MSALVKALHQARFTADHLDPVVWSTPFVIDLYVAALAEHERRRILAGRCLSQTSREFYKWRGRPEHAPVLANFDRSST